jgi:hypothetical protein
VNHVPAVPHSFIGQILGIAKGTVEYHFKRYADVGADAGRWSRPPLLGDEREPVEDAYRRGIPWTIAEILDFIQEGSLEPVDKNSVYHWLQREPRIKSCRGVPMEDHRIAVTPDAILDYFQRAIATIDGVPAHFVFNLHEMGHQEWADRHE